MPSRMNPREKRRLVSAALGLPSLSATTAGTLHLAPDDHPVYSETLLPPLALELGIRMLLHRVADAEVSNQKPILGHLECASDFSRFENRHPANSEAVSACGEPQRLHSGHRRVAHHLGHRMSSQAVADRRGLIDEDGHLTWRLSQAGELQLTVQCCPCARVRGPGGIVTASEDCTDPLSARRIIHKDEAPRLAIAHRGGQACEVQYLI